MCPLALDPQQRFELVLDSDEEKPEKERPTFIFRFLSNREWKRLAKLQDRIDELVKQDDLEVMMAEMEDTLRMGLVGWRNMIEPLTGQEIPFNLDDIDRIITVSETSELILKALKQVSLDMADKKKSVLQSRSSTEDSAKSANRPEPVTPDQAS